MALYYNCNWSFINNWCWKYKYWFSGLARIILKNYRWENISLYFPLLYLFFLIKTVKHFVTRRDFNVVTSFIASNLIFIWDLKDTFKKRKYIQRTRIMNDNRFRDLKPPKLI